MKRPATGTMDKILAEACGERPADDANETNDANETDDAIGSGEKNESDGSKGDPTNGATSSVGNGKSDGGKGKDVKNNNVKVPKRGKPCDYYFKKDGTIDVERCIPRTPSPDVREP